MLSLPDRDLVRRDVALPGLATVLDPAAMMDVLRRDRPDLRLDGAITYVRYKPGTSCLVGYCARLDGADLLLSVQARRPDTEDKLAKAHNKPGVPGPLGPGRFLIPDVAVVVSVFPNDRRLPALKRFADPDKVRSLVRELAADHRRARRCRLQMLHYRPERRCVARLVGDAGPVALVKLHPKGAFDRACRNAAAFTSHGDLLIPALIGRSPSWRAVAAEWLHGDIADPTATGAARIGAALALLHAQDADVALTLTREAQVRGLRALVRDISRLWPPLADRCRRVAKRLGVALLEEHGAFRPIHGDFYAEQVVMAGDRVGLIDFDEAAVGSPAWDLGNFIGHLHYRSLSGDPRGEPPDVVGAGLIDRYRAAGGEVSAREVRLQTAVGLMRLGARPFRERDPHWPDRIELILTRVEALLEAVAPLHAASETPPATSIDPALPLIEQALDRRVATRHFARDVLGAGRWRIDDARLVRHKPGRRCLIEYRLGAGAGETSFLLGKMRARGADRRSYALQRELWQSAFGPATADRIMVSEPVAIVPELGLWLQRKGPGLALSDLLDPATVPDAARIARAIAKLHRSGIAARRHHAMGEELRILGERLSSLARRRPEWAGRIDALRKAATMLARRAVPAGECSIHRDFYPDHILVHDDELRILDLDLYSAGDGAVDIGNFLGHVIEHGLRLRGEADFLAEWRAEFEAAYRRLIGGVSAVNIRIYELLTLMRLVEISTRIPERRPFTGLLLEDCEHRVRAALGRQGMTT